MSFKQIGDQAVGNVDDYEACGWESSGLMIMEATAMYVNAVEGSVRKRGLGEWADGGGRHTPTAK